MMLRLSLKQRSIVAASRVVIVVEKMRCYGGWMNVVRYVIGRMVVEIAQSIRLYDSRRRMLLLVVVMCRLHHHLVAALCLLCARAVSAGNYVIRVLERLVGRRQPPQS